MHVSYHPSEDIVMLGEGKQYIDDNEDLEYDWSVILGYAEEDGKEIASVDIIGISGWLKIGYDAETDTLALGRDPEPNCQVLESGEFVGYRRWFDFGDGDGYWQTVKLELRNASRHLAEVFAHLGLSPDAAPAEGDGRPPDGG